MIRKIVFTAALGALTLSSTACNTVKGLGRDIESVGQEGEEIITYAPNDRDKQDAQDAQ